MNRRHLSGVLFILILGMAVGFLWLLFRPPAGVVVEKRLTDYEAERAAGTLPRAADSVVSSPEVDIAGTFEAFDGVPGKTRSSWSRFRGVGFSNTSVDTISIATDWSAEGPPVLWKVSLGEGYAGPAIHAGRVFVLDYDVGQEGDSLRCFSFADGKEIWRRTYHAPIKKNHGYSRTVPAVTDDYVVTLGPRCIAMCVRPETGEFLWGIDLVTDYQAEVPLWYTGQCPLIDDGVAVFAPGGQALMIGVDCATGEVLWETPNPKGWKMSHSSIVPATILGRPMYVYCASQGVIGVSADPDDRGELLWSTTEWAHSVTSPSPLPIADDKIFFTAGYGGGSMMMGFREQDGLIEAVPLYELDKSVFACEQHTPLLHEGHLFGVLPKDASEFRNQFACIDLEGQVAWTSGKTERFGLGPFLLANDFIFILSDDGELTLIRASTRGYEQLARAQVLHGREAWAPMALADGKLILRDFEEMICINVGAPTRLSMVGER